MQKTYKFENGYGASVIDHGNGSPSAPYELAVLVYDGNTSEICYDTPITDDVLGYLTQADVDNLCQQIRALPPRER